MLKKPADCFPLGENLGRTGEERVEHSLVDVQPVEGHRGLVRDLHLELHLGQDQDHVQPLPHLSRPRSVV